VGEVIGFRERGGREGGIFKKILNTITGIFLG
jgi:hypothetical protein